MEEGSPKAKERERRPKTLGVVPLVAKVVMKKHKGEHCITVPNGLPLTESSVRTREELAENVV